MITAFFLALSILAVGLFSGLMYALVFLMQLKWDRQSAAEYIADIQPFLRVGKGNRTVALTLFVGLLAPIPALLNAYIVEQPVVAVLILLGLVVFGLGALAVTVGLNLPTYTALMSLDVRRPSRNWEDLRRRFYHLNLVRFLGSVTAFALFVAALAFWPAGA